MVALDDPRGDDADHPGMPALRREHVGRAIAELAHLLLGLPHDPLLDRPTLGVDRVELGGDLGRTCGIVAEEKLEPGVGAP